MRQTDTERYDRICGEILAALERPSCAETKVSEEAVRRRAAEMAKEGYLPSPQTILALGYYLKGYGLWLSGGVGTGKTEFFRHLRPLPLPTKATGRPPRILILPMVRTVEMTVEDLKEWLDEARNAEVVIDDVGAEPVFNHFGGKFEILPYILDKRLDSPCRTHATSNLSAKAMGDRYHDARILDRFAEMFVKVEFGGASRRRSKQNVAIRRGLEAVARREAAKAPETPVSAGAVAATSAASANRVEDGGRCASEEGAL